MIYLNYSTKLFISYALIIKDSEQPSTR
ncbi:Cro/Cl family transcriptional regulator, partial [Yersinia enterocolitica]|nr:Cro/Cl family transcriptional regulator [Yersinia enterocolitica]EKN6263326.1 Cro/Cl family transcriptional regulator [Yersinia enterocolitica]